MKQHSDKKVPFFSFRTHESRKIGSGWLSGVIALSCALLAFGTVLCVKYPALFTLPELRQLYPLNLIRGILLLIIGASFITGVISLTLRQNKAFGISSIIISGVTVMMGGHLATPGEFQGNPLISLDWHLTNLIFFCLIFIPLERAFALRTEQAVFRPQWKTDLGYFAINHLGIQILSVLITLPALLLFNQATLTPLKYEISSLWLPFQVILIVVIADFFQYWIHRRLHKVPGLWRIHAIHHSVQTMDWLAGSRLHILDVLITRSLVYIPIFLSGFSQTAILIYGGIAAIQATFIHANVRWRFRSLCKFIVTPQFHHWHHSSENKAIDKNFSVHLPIWDRLFGTYYMPQRWPTTYGLASNEKMSANILKQLWYPFKR